MQWPKDKRQEEKQWLTNYYTDENTKNVNTVKPVLRGHLWDKEQVAV